MNNHYTFSSKKIPKLSEVGGKALSLILSTQSGLPVPDGFVLTVNFFKDWLSKVEHTEQWQQAVNATTEDRKKHLDEVKKKARHFTFNNEQSKELKTALKKLNASIMAVRSSSPEEDLEGASFAGGYETVLGVTEKTLEEAIHTAFVSCLDERIFVYKKEHGFNPTTPKIAIIVQKQIASDVSGVAFSLNPQNNCFDEAVINSNFGLGETVVAGQVTPDTYIVDMPTQQILEKKISNKDHAIWLTKNGGTETKDNPEPTSPSLTDHQAKSVAKLAEKAEKYFQKPIDIEWAYSKDKLYLLQARPVTAYFPLPTSLTTKAGETKYLFVNMSLVKQGIPGVMSPMGADIMAYMTDVAGDMFSGETLSDPKKGISAFSDGVLVTQVGNMQKLLGKKATATSIHIGGQSVVDTYKSINMDEYLPKKLSKELAKARRRLIWFALKQMPEIIKGLMNPLEYLKTYQKHDAEQAKEHQQLYNRKFKTLQEVVQEGLKANMYAFMDEIPTIIAGARLAKFRIDRIFKKDDVKDLLGHLERALPGNKTSEMGQMLYELAKQPEIQNTENAQQFIQKLHQRKFPKKFLDMWDNYIKIHGFRGMGELDIATPRSYETPKDLFNTIKNMSEQVKKGGESTFEKARRTREEAYKQLEKIARAKGKRKLKKLQKNYKVFLALAGLRENPKYNMIRMLDFIRTKSLEFGENLVKEDRIDKPQDIFSLTIKQIDAGVQNPKLDLRARIQENTAYARQVGDRTLPTFFDSRGKIFRPPAKQTRENTLAGESISPGTVTGRVKVLKDAHEKPILPGEILVAKATDPGWTPLFINAAAIVLENGGALQHGAVVAREYGKPCVSSIINATQILKDGQLVEVDGSNGFIRIINEDNPYMGQQPKWEVTEPDAVLTRVSIVELMPDPLTPLFATMSADAIVKGMEDVIAYIFKSNTFEKFEAKFPVLNGYGYYQMKLKLWPYLKMVFGSIKFIPWIFNKTIPDWKDRRKPQFEAEIDGWKQQDMQNMSCEKLLQGAEELTTKTMDYYTAVQSMLPVIYLGESTFMWFYNTFVRRKNDPPFETFVMGYDSLPINADKSLYDMAIWTQKHNDLTKYILKTPNEQLSQLLTNKTAPKGIEQSVWGQWQSKFHTHLKLYGHMIYDIDIAKAVPADAPEPLLTTMKYFLSGEGVDPHKRQQDMIKDRETSTKKTQKRLGFIRRYLFTKLLKFAQDKVPYREDGLADIGLAYPVARKMFAELGNRLKKQHVINDIQDIYWLEIDELKKIANQLDNNNKLESQNDKIEDRKKIWEWQRTLTPPPILPTKGLLVKMMSKYFPDVSDQDHLETLKGLGASKGEVTGTARVILGPDDFDKMQPGDILVTAITTPAWTPLFALASGIVTDVGGALSHSSIVAREYGIPAVLGTGVASKQIKNGQTISVDGNTGTVTLL